MVDVDPESVIIAVKVTSSASATPSLIASRSVAVLLIVTLPFSLPVIV